MTFLELPLVEIPTSHPMAAAVVARMRGGYAMSKVPFEATSARRRLF